MAVDPAREAAVAQHCSARRRAAAKQAAVQVGARPAPEAHRQAVQRLEVVGVAEAAQLVDRLAAGRLAVRLPDGQDHLDLPVHPDGNRGDRRAAAALEVVSKAAALRPAAVKAAQIAAARLPEAVQAEVAAAVPDAPLAAGVEEAEVVVPGALRGAAEEVVAVAEPDARQVAAVVEQAVSEAAEEQRQASAVLLSSQRAAASARAKSRQQCGPRFVRDRRWSDQREMQRRR